MAEKLEAAKAENSREVPREMLEKFTVHDPKIQFIHTTSARSAIAKGKMSIDNPIQRIVDADRSSAPLYIHYEHVPTNFVHIAVLISTAQIPVSLRPLLVLYADLFFSSPMMRNGERLEFEDVVMGLERDTVEYELGTAMSFANGEMLSAVIAAERENYETCIQWLRDLFWNGIYDVEVTALLKVILYC